MKKIILLLIILISLSLTGCNKADKYKGNIVEFHYNYGSYNSGYYYYSITKENDKFIFSAEGYNNVNLNINKEIDKSNLKRLAKIINANNINKWNGFNESNDDILDGNHFYLKVEYDDGKTIEASGYMKYPKNYDKGDKALKEFLNSFN